MATKQETDAAFAAAGFTKGGGIWGEAQWKRLDAETVASITTVDQDSPADLDDEQVILHVYTGGKTAEWVAGPDSEAPEDCESEQLEFLRPRDALAYLAAEQARS